VAIARELERIVTPYFGVLEEGVVGKGDPIERVHIDENRFSVSAMLGLILERHPSPDALRRVLEISALADVWRQRFEERLGA
jgi:MOSC domain-containing protein YiiM